MHYLSSLITDIDKTHPHLGNLAAMCQLSIKAKKLLLTIAPRGCGKSRVSSYIGLDYPGASVHDRISVAGLVYLKDEFSGFQSVIVVDDIAKTQTPYARIATITTIAELIYSHYCKSSMQGMSYSIEDFNGSAIINVQPVLLKELVKSDEWEASIQDKSIRYYHLYRPQQPNKYPPKATLQWGKEFKLVEDFDLVPKTAKRLIEITGVQWGSSRLIEHVVDLLKAAAALDGRVKVNATDYKVLERVLLPLSYESLVMSKNQFESDRFMDSNLLAVLTEYVTYGKFTINQLSDDYKLSHSQCYRIMSQSTKQWVEVEKSPTTYAPSKELQIELERLKLDGK